MKDFNNFSEVRVLVVGDLMIDEYLIGDVTRISPEAPVPVVRLKETKMIAGGAGNVAANVAGLGGTPYLVSVAGGDAAGASLPEILSRAGIAADNIVKIAHRPTTIKTRIMAHNQQIVRIDRETEDLLNDADEALLWEAAHRLFDRIDIVVISDYNKGLMSRKITERLIIEAANLNKIILADPKGKDYGKYKNATVLTPNKYEVAVVCGIDPEDESALLEAGRELLSALNLQALLITCGEKGMIVLERNKSAAHLSASARNVYDVTGAGDTAIAALAVALGAGFSLLEAARTANAAAGLVVEQLGTSVVRLGELRQFMNAQR